MKQSKNALVLFTDLGYLAVSCFTLVSAKRAAPETVYDAIMVLSDVCEAEKSRAREYLSSHGINVRLLDQDAAALDAFKAPTSLPKVTFGRLFLEDMLGQHYDRVVYIDGDTQIDLDIQQVFDFDLKGKPLGAVVETGMSIGPDLPTFTQRLGLSESGYFNAGVLLLDWKAWIAGDFAQKSARAAISTPDLFIHADQCVLNQVCANDWTPLPFIFNYTSFDNEYWPEAQAIFHFIGVKKPWKHKLVRNQWRFIARYRDYFLNSPWAEQYEKPLPMEWLYRLQNFSRIHLKFPKNTSRQRGREFRLENDPGLR